MGRGPRPPVWLAVLVSARRAAALINSPGLTFGVLSNWGGQGTSPYTTPGQVAAAAALEAVAAATKAAFVVSAGGNFLPQGLPGARQDWDHPRG